MDIQIMPLVADHLWSHGGWRISTYLVEDGKFKYTLHDDPELPGEPPPEFTSQETALRQLESEVNFQADLVLESPAIKAVRDGDFTSLTKLYSMYRMPASGEAHCRILKGPGDEGTPLDPRTDLWNHSPTGIEWGYGGSGPAQLALGILADALGSDRLASRLYQRFKFEWVAPWHQERAWIISQLQVACWGLEQQAEVWPKTKIAEGTNG